MIHQLLRIFFFLGFSGVAIFLWIVSYKLCVQSEWFSAACGLLGSTLPVYMATSLVRMET